MSEKNMQFTAFLRNGTIDLYGDIFVDETRAKTATPIKFVTRYCFTKDKGDPFLRLNKGEAQELISELQDAMSKIGE